MTTQDKTPGSAPERKNRFDEADRQRVRVTLFRYMEDHRIGVPTLIAHMAKAVKREQRYIPQKTLQRFLEARIRTNDAVVSIFYEFSQTLPPARDEVAELGLTLGQFFRTRAAAGAQEEPAPLSPGSYTGSPADNTRVFSPSGCSLTVQRGSRLLEQEFAPPLPAGARPADQETGRPRGEHFEGILIAFAGFHVGVLRSSATRRPRVHWFTPAAGSGLQSFCQSAPVQDGRGQIPVVVSGLLSYVPVPDVRT